MIEKILFFAVHLAIPVLLLVWELYRRPKSQMAQISRSIFSVSLLVFLFFWGQWPFVGSYYLRYLLIGLVLFFIIRCFTHYREVPAFWPIEWYRFLSVILTGFISAIIILGITRLVTGQNYPDDVITLNFPFKNGTYYIASGGSNKFVNNHFRSYPNAQQYAIDINRLGRLGSVSGNVFSGKNENHFIFRDTVSSPCSGIITHLRNDVPDNTHSSMDVDPKNGMGNFVKIECQGIEITLSHLYEGSILINTGDRIDSGMPIGLVGNSGFSQEPHLHIQAARYSQDSSLIGIPIQFGADTYSRNDLVRKSADD